VAACDSSAPRHTQVLVELRDQMARVRMPEAYRRAEGAGFVGNLERAACKKVHTRVGRCVSDIEIRENYEALAVFGPVVGACADGAAVAEVAQDVRTCMYVCV
jgi:hypothetical protein